MQNSSTLVKLNSSTLVKLNSSSLVKLNSSTLVKLNSSTLVKLNSSTLVKQNCSQMTYSVAISTEYGSIIPFLVVNYVIKQILKSVLQVTPTLFKLNPTWMYNRLPEVALRREEERREAASRSNRLRAELFNK
ncbi:hypothetical protein NHX12_022154, partial [Muraenolepis orangiensis]